MTGARKVTQREPQRVDWVDIDPAGNDTPRTGWLWSQAPDLEGMPAFWVQPTDGTATALVCRASRRHRVGRARARRSSVPFGPARTVHLYVPKAGRYVDVGEWFRETDPRSRFTRTFTPPTRLAPLAVPNVAEMAAIVALGLMLEEEAP